MVRVAHRDMDNRNPSNRAPKQTRPPPSQGWFFTKSDRAWSTCSRQDGAAAPQSSHPPSIVQMADTWQSPGIALEMLMDEFRYVSSWRGSTCQRSNHWWDAHDQTAAQWRAGALLCQVSSGWLLAVAQWRESFSWLPILRICHNIKAVDDAVVCRLCRACPALTTLDVGTSTITDAVLEFVAAQCARVNTINLSRCAKAPGSAGVAALARCASLRDLNLSGNWNGHGGLGVEALTALSALKLQRLNLTGWACGSNHRIASLRISIP
jgi:hypothetical protein